MTFTPQDSPELIVKKISISTIREVLESCDGNQGKQSKRANQNKQKKHKSLPKSAQNRVQSNPEIIKTQI